MPEVISGRYMILDAEPPRRGGLSTVRKAVDVRSGDFVAVKYVIAATDDLTRKIFDREVATLRTLSHPNVVKLLDAGLDETDTYFLVLEWAERNLDDLLDEQGPLAWDDVVDTLALPLANALSHAHLKQVEHRDIKPGNVLIASDGTPLLADFGIGKLRQDVATDLTVAAFRSGIWAPPELDAPVPFVRDVYSLALLLVQAMHEDDLRDYHEIDAALGSLAVPPQVRRLLERSVDADPTARPANGSVFLDELSRALQSERRDAVAQKHVAWLQLTKAARTQLVGSEADPAEAEPVLLKDLRNAPHVEFRWDADAAEYDRNLIFVIGDEWRVTLRPEIATGKLVVTGARALEFEALEAARRRAMPVVGWLSWQLQAPHPPQLAKHGLERLLESMDGYYAARDAGSSSVDDGPTSDLMDTWSRTLQAREDLARGDLGKLLYSERKQQKRELRLELSEPCEVDLVGTEWEIRQSGTQRRLARGEVVFQAGQQIALLLRGRTRAVPDKGEMVRHLGPSQVALQRQNDAISSVKNGTSVCGNLGELLSDPSKACPPREVEVTTWFTDLDADKRRAVKAALGTEEILLVKGPPGTGKTSFITELVAQTLERHPEARVLIVSQTHVAVDNALERLSAAGLSGLVRLGNRDDPRISPSVQQLLLDEQMGRWAASLRQRAERHLDALAKAAGLPPRHLHAALALQRLVASLQQQERIEAQLLREEEQSTGGTRAIETGLGLARDATQLQQRLDDIVEEQGSLRESARQHLAGDLTLRTEMSSEEARAAVDVLLGDSDEGRRLLRLLELQAEWLQRVASDDHLAAAFLQTSRVIAGTCLGFLRHPAVRGLDIDLCILDEASKATATEALVPLARAKRSVLVGDTHQLPPLDEDLLRRSDLLDDYGLTPDQVKETLFQRLADRLPAGNQYALLDQYRMVRPIGDLISTCFYDGELRSPKSDGLKGYQLLSRPVLWLDTSGLRERRREDVSAGVAPSFANRLEALLVAERLQSLDGAVSKGVLHPPDPTKPLEVLVIAPYRNQIAELRRRLAPLKLRSLKIDIESVDAVQGREADLALFSVTRSNPQGRLGFLGQEYWRRINVALSRARYGLTIVGDAEFCRGTSGALNRVLEYMLENTEDCELRQVESA